MDDFGFVMGESMGSTAATGPNLNAFYASPEFQLFGDQNSRAMQDTFAALSGAGLADSGIGRETVTNTATRNLNNAFNSFVNRNLGLSDRGQNAAVQGGNFQAGGNALSANLNQNLGAVNGAMAINTAQSAANLGNDVVNAFTAGSGGGGGFNSGNAFQSLFA